jgi:hypothetical protein
MESLWKEIKKSASIVPADEIYRTIERARIAGGAQTVYRR